MARILRFIFSLIVLGIPHALPFACGAQPYQRQAFPQAFMNETENIINNSIHLRGFFEKLYQLKKGETKQVNIVHIGDSHIQADFLTQVVRKNLQFEFGNAGRGFIFPYRVAGTNEPFNFRSSGLGKWESRRLVQSSGSLPLGLGGITIQSKDPSCGIIIKMTDEHYQYEFNTLSLFFERVQNGAGYSIRDSLDGEIAVIPPGTPDEKSVERVMLPGSMKSVTIRCIPQGGDETLSTFYGLSAENGVAGILYHAIGVNGAKYEHYNKIPDFGEQVGLLNPDLIIISLGTNESVGYPGLPKDIGSQISTLIQRFATTNPDLSFLLVTPADFFQKKNRINPGVGIIRHEILRHAVENGIAFWDMFRIGGSATMWRDAGMLRPDGVHFTRDGYALQGLLLYEAIMKGYQEYESTRHP